MRPRLASDGQYGRLEAINLDTKAIAWIVCQGAPETSGVPATEGGVVFAGSIDRFIRAYDDANGKVLWQARLNNIPSSSPIAYSVNGKEYVAIVAGNGGAHAITWPPLVPEIRNPPSLGPAIWVFELPWEVAMPITDKQRLQQTVGTRTCFLESNLSTRLPKGAERCASPFVSVL